MKRLAAVITASALVLGGFIVIGGAAESASANNRVCKTVTIPKSLPWWECVSFTPGLPLNYGCYVHTKVVCSG